MDSHHVTLFLFDLALILALARLLGGLAVRLHQPPVVGEIAAGVLLGPTLFDGLLGKALFPPDILLPLTTMADVGVALFMFGVGLETDTSALRGRVRLTACAAAGSVLLPFAIGAVLAQSLFTEHGTGQRPAFIVFMGLALAVTAFPVLARILADRGLSRTELGGIALATAAIVDLVAWTALAGVQAALDTEAPWRTGLMIPFVILMSFLIRPLLRRALLRAAQQASPPAAQVTLILPGVLVAGAATEAMGMHYIFGAFMFGLVVPRDTATPMTASLSENIGRLTSFLLPPYFVVTGLRIDLSGLSSDDILQFGVILVTAMGGKLGGTYLGARSQGLPPRAAAGLSTMVTTKGLTDLVVLGVGLDLGLLDRSLYTVMVTATVTITVLTGPLLSVIYRKPVHFAPDAETHDLRVRTRTG